MDMIFNSIRYVKQKPQHSEPKSELVSLCADTHRHIFGPHTALKKLLKMLM